MNNLTYEVIRDRIIELNDMFNNLNAIKYNNNNNVKEEIEFTTLNGIIVWKRESDGDRLSFNKMVYIFMVGKPNKESELSLTNITYHECSKNNSIISDNNYREYTEEELFQLSTTYEPIIIIGMRLLHFMSYHNFTGSHFIRYDLFEDETYNKVLKRYKEIIDEHEL